MVRFEEKGIPIFSVGEKGRFLLTSPELWIKIGSKNRPEWALEKGKQNEDI